MTTKPGRRQFLASTMAFAGLVAFDPIGRRWLTVANAGQCSRAISIPDIEGELSLDGNVIDAANRDFGNIATGDAVAVLRPSGAEDIVRVIRYANQHGIKVAMQGQLHSVLGQALTDCGIVIDSRTLDGIDSIEGDSVWVGAGLKWSTLLANTLQSGLTPPVLTDYLQLSIGGVVSVGGIGGASNKFGFVANNVIELEVVTGEGQLVLCSRNRNRTLFDAVRGGLGQFGIITRVRVALASATQFARIYEYTYSDLSKFLSDMRKVANEERFDYIEGQLVANGAGGWNFKLEGGVWYDADAVPDDDRFTADLRADVSTASTDYPYAVWLSRIDFAETALRGLGLWDTPHPWSDLFLNDRTLELYLNSVIDKIDENGIGAGLILLYPMRRKKLGLSRTIPLPRGKFVWAFDILRFPFFPDDQEVERLLEQNRQLFEQSRKFGGKRYAIGALRFNPADWRRHYGRLYRRLARAKARFDPRQVLTPGQGIEWRRRQ